MSGKDDLSRPEKFQISNTQHPFSRTPTSKAQSFCNKDQVGGRQGSNRKPFKLQTLQTLQTLNPEHLYLLVALPHLWHNHSAIKTKWEGDWV